MPIEVMPNILTITRQSNAVQTKCINQQIAVILESNVDAENYMWYFGTTSSGPFTKTDSMKQIIRVAKTRLLQGSIIEGAMSVTRADI